MNKFFILVLLFNIFSCEKEVIKKEAAPSPSHSTPVAQPERKELLVDSVLLNPFDSKILKEFYKSKDYKIVWQSKENRKILLEQLYNSEEEGLNPADYNVNKLRKYEEKIDVLDNQKIVNYDILLTRSFQKYISHLTNGRLNPKKLYADWDLKENKIDINETISSLLKSDSLTHKIDLLKPYHVVYKKLKKALKIINTLPKDAFSRIQITNKIVLNDTNPSLINIKKRLIYWKDMPPKDSISSIYDSETAEAIKKFQTRHGLAADGVIGKGTVASLNFSKRQRREQIIANLERWKWFPREMGKEYLGSAEKLRDAFIFHFHKRHSS